MLLSTEQAKVISIMMGFKYTHHSAEILCVEMDDKNPNVYFYYGMSPYTFKLDTITGICSNLLSGLLLDQETLLHLQEDAMNRDPEMVSLLTKKLQDIKIWKDNNEKVIEFLKQENLL